MFLESYCLAGELDEGNPLRILFFIGPTEILTKAESILVKASEKQLGFPWEAKIKNIVSTDISIGDSAMEDLSNSDSINFAEVERLRDNSLNLNVKKTKEMLTDFRNALAVIPDLFIAGVKVERVTWVQISRNSLTLGQQAEF